MLVYNGILLNHKLWHCKLSKDLLQLSRVGKNLFSQSFGRKMKVFNEEPQIPVNKRCMFPSINVKRYLVCHDLNAS